MSFAKFRPLSLSRLDTTQNIQTIHSAADASWQDNGSGSFSLLLEEEKVTGSLFDKAKQRFVQLKSIAAAPVRLLSDMSSLRDIYSMPAQENCDIFLPGNKATLVPEALYEEKDTEHFFKLSHTLEDNEAVLADYLKSIGAWLLYAVSSPLRNALSRNFSRSGIFHNATPWLEALHLLYKNDSESHIHVDVQKNSIQLAVFADTALQFFNIFPCTNDEEKLYFILFVSEQLKLNPHKDRYYISGNVQKSDELHNLLKKYIKELQLQRRPELYQYSLPVQTLPEHIYFKSFCTPVCES